MATARDLIKRSMQLIGVISPGETPTASELSDGLSSLNEMLETWAIDGYNIFEEKREVFSLVGNQQTYTIGDSGDFDTVRPHIIKSAKIKHSNNEIRLDIYNQDQWAGIGVKDLLSTIPQVLYYNQAFPLGEISIWPKPSESNDLVLYSLKPLSTFEDANADVELPPGYMRALRFNLACELAPEYGRPILPKVEEVAVKSLAQIKRANVKPVYMRNEVAEVIDRKPFNWLTGE